MTEQFEKFVEPIKEINELTVKNLETVADLQIKQAEENINIGLEQVKNAAAVTDADSWKSFVEMQAEITRQFNERVVTNARTFVELGTAYNNEVQRIVKGAFAA